MGAKLLPWTCWQEWEDTGRKLLSAQERAEGLARVEAWRCRGRVPLAVETTAALAEAMQLDSPVPQHLNSSTQAAAEPSSHSLRLLYAMALIRLVNGVSDAQQRGRVATSLTLLASSAGLPRVLVDIRHDATHGELPSLALLRTGAAAALHWLQGTYWDGQARHVQANLERAGLLLRALLASCQTAATTLPGSNGKATATTKASKAGRGSSSRDSSRGSSSSSKLLKVWSHRPRGRESSDEEEEGEEEEEEEEKQGGRKGKRLAADAADAQLDWRLECSPEAPPTTPTGKQARRELVSALRALIPTAWCSTMVPGCLRDSNLSPPLGRRELSAWRQGCQGLDLLAHPHQLGQPLDEYQDTAAELAALKAWFTWAGLLFKTYPSLRLQLLRSCVSRLAILAATLPASQDQEVLSLGAWLVCLLPLTLNEGDTLGPGTRAGSAATRTPKPLGNHTNPGRKGKRPRRDTQPPPPPPQQQQQQHREAAGAEHPAAAAAPGRVLGRPAPISGSPGGGEGQVWGSVMQKDPVAVRAEHLAVLAALAHPSSLLQAPSTPNTAPAHGAVKDGVKGGVAAGVDDAVGGRQGEGGQQLAPLSQGSEQQQAAATSWQSSLAKAGSRCLPEPGVGREGREGWEQHGQPPHAEPGLDPMQPMQLMQHDRPPAAAAEAAKAEEAGCLGQPGQGQGSNAGAQGVSHASKEVHETGEGVWQQQRQGEGQGQEGPGLGLVAEPPAWNLDLKTWPASSTQHGRPDSLHHQAAAMDFSTSSREGEMREAVERGADAEAKAAMEGSGELESSSSSSSSSDSGREGRGEAVMAWAWPAALAGVDLTEVSLTVRRL
ncbi:Las1-like-domain-containing protein [Haematococcus lacustris]